MRVVSACCVACVRRAFHSLVDMPSRSKSVFDVDAMGGMGFLRANRTFLRRSSVVVSQEAIRQYWQIILKNPRSRRPPLVTLSIVAAMIVVHFVTTTDSGASGIPYTPAGPWYSALGAMFSHVSNTHLWSNVLMLSVVGPFLEFTEGFRHVAAVSFGSGLLGAAAHGAMRPHSRVRGTSGAIYGILPQCTLDRPTPLFTLSTICSSRYHGVAIGSVSFELS